MVEADTLEHKLSTKPFQIIATIITLAFFFVIVVAPTIYVFVTVFLQWSEVNSVIFVDPITGNSNWLLMQEALIRSFQIALLVTIIDVIIGFPMAMIMARYEFRMKNFVDTLIDIPMAVPTSALGFSIFLFWGTSSGPFGFLGLETGIISRGVMLIILAHVAFTYPYIVRSLRSIVMNVDLKIEQAARTLGASSFTVFRTISAPLMKEGLIAGAILAFTRSLGETGATLIVSGIYETAPVLIVSLQKTMKIPATAFLSMILVIIAIALLTTLRFSARRVGLPIEKIWPRPERWLSSKWIRHGRDITTYIFFLMLILFPSLFLFPYLLTWWSGSPYSGNVEAGAWYQIFIAPDRKWRSLWISLVTSFQIAGIATLVNFVFALPMAFIIVRKKWGKINEFLNALVDIPLVIPSSALGFSVFLFWGTQGLQIIRPGFWLIVIVHVTFTYPYSVRPLVAIVAGLDPGLEEAAVSLGAAPLTTFRRITLPLLSQGILASAIMTFTRSLGETGATIVVMGLDRTIPVLIVDWVESLVLPAAAFACIVLIVISYCLLLLLRIVGEGLGVR